MKYLLLLIFISSVMGLEEAKEKALTGIISQIDSYKIDALAGLRVYYDGRKIGDLEEAIIQTDKAFESLKKLWIDQIKNGVIGDIDIVQYRITEIIAVNKRNANKQVLELGDVKRQIDFLLWLSDRSGKLQFSGDYPKVY